MRPSAVFLVVSTCVSPLARPAAVARILLVFRDLLLPRRVIFIELVPGWALYRGLYEISQYAFRAAQQVGGRDRLRSAGCV